MTNSASIKEERRTVSPDLTSLLFETGQEVIHRVLERYLPNRARGFVGDDRESAGPNSPTLDPYRILGLKPSASAIDVRRRVRELAKIFHPDLPAGDAEKMAEVNEAARAIAAASEPR